MADNAGFQVDRIGRWGDESEFKVERDRTIAYAKATNDPIKQHLDGTLAPPVFAVVPAFQTTRRDDQYQRLCRWRQHLPLPNHG